MTAMGSVKRSETETPRPYTSAKGAQYDSQGQA
jgi:hypothetical protein